MNTWLSDVFERLNQFIYESNQQADYEGSPPIRKQEVRIVGQMALLLANLPFPVTTTMDLDLTTALDYPVARTLKKYLLEKNIRLETDSHLIWMPDDTVYLPLLDFNHVTIKVASPVDVISSKYRFGRDKDKLLIQTYLDYFPDQKEKIIHKAKK